MNIEPCMFCGNKVILDEQQYAVFIWVECANPECRAMGPNRETKGEAITAWNDVARIVREVREEKK